MPCIAQEHESLQTFRTTAKAERDRLAREVALCADREKGLISRSAYLVRLPALPSRLFRQPETRCNACVFHSATLVALTATAGQATD